MDNTFIISHLQREIGGKQHVCTTACVTQPIRVHIHERDDGEHIRWSKNNQPWMNKTTFKRSLQYVFVCQSSRTVHHCTRDCTLEPVANSDYTLGCPVSGVQWDNETEVVRSWKLTSKCVPCIVSDKRDPNMYSRDVDGNVMPMTLNIKDELCRRTVYRMLRLLVCSQQRIAHELEKYRMGKQSALKQVNRYVKYAKKNGFVNVCTVMNIYTTECFRRPNFLRIMTTYTQELEMYTSKLYPTIMRLWKIMFNPRVFTFDVFVPAMLYIMQRGIRLNNIAVIEPYHVLEIILPDANVLDEFGITKSTFTQTKNAIRASVRKLLENVSTQNLRKMLH